MQDKNSHAMRVHLKSQLFIHFCISTHHWCVSFRRVHHPPLLCAATTSAKPTKPHRPAPPTVLGNIRTASVPLFPHAIQIQHRIRPCGRARHFPNPRTLVRGPRACAWFGSARQVDDGEACLQVSPLPAGLAVSSSPSHLPALPSSVASCPTPRLRPQPRRLAGRPRRPSLGASPLMPAPGPRARAALNRPSRSSSDADKRWPREPGPGPAPAHGPWHGAAQHGITGRGRGGQLS